MFDISDFLTGGIGDLTILGSRKMRIFTGLTGAVIGGLFGYFLGGGDTILEIVGMVIVGVIFGGGLGALFSSGILLVIFIAVCIGLWFAANSIWGT